MITLYPFRFLVVGQIFGEIIKPGAKLFRGGIVRKRGLREKSAAGTLGLFEWRMRADVFQSFPRRKFRQSASDPPRTDADCRGINLVRRVRGGFRVGNFYSAKNKICRIPRRRQSDPLAPIRTQADSIGVRRGIVPPPRLPRFGVGQVVKNSCSTFVYVHNNLDCFLF